MPAAHLAQAQEGADHGSLLSQRLRTEETGVLRGDEGAMATCAVQRWAGMTGWHAAVSKRKHVHFQHQIQVSMCSYVQAPQVVCLSSPALFNGAACAVQLSGRHQITTFIGTCREPSQHPCQGVHAKGMVYVRL